MFILIMIYLVLLVIRPQDYPAVVDNPGPPLQQITLLIAGMFWLLSRHKRLDSPQHVLLFLFYIVLMVSSIATGWFGGAIIQLEKFGPTLLAFLIMAAALNSQPRLRTAMAILTLCATVLAIHGIEQANLGLGWTGVGLSQGTRIQYVGIFNDPNDLGMLFATCLPMAFYLARKGGLLGFRRLFWWSMAGLLLYGVFLTDSRGTMLAVLAMLAVYAWHRYGAGIAGVAVACGVGILLLLPSRIQEMDVTEDSAMGRVESWYEGLQMFRSSPFLGIGPDRYSDMYNLTAHNSFVLVLAETGIIGFILWIAFVGYSFRMMSAGVSGSPALTQFEYSNLDNGTNSEDVESDLDAWNDAVRTHHEDRALALTLLLSLTGFFTCAFFLSRSYVVVLYLLAAMVVAHYGAMQVRAPDMPQFRLERELILWPAVALASIVGLAVLVKILLATV